MPRNEAVRILVADDNEINQRVIRGMLEHRGYAVHAVKNGEEVLAALPDVSYDLVIMDCLMPVMDGYEATRSIRSARSGGFDPDIPVLAITALAAPGDREKCLDAGMTDYISKPVVADQLYRKLDALINGSATGQPARPLPDFVSALSGKLAGDVKTWRRELADLRPEEDLEEIGRLAHKIRGAADVFTADRLSRAASDLEAAARRNDTGVAAALKADLNRELEHLQRQLRGSD